jgi:parvulin-like peptidyl-prolyl isomerase
VTDADVEAQLKRLLDGTAGDGEASPPAGAAGASIPVIRSRVREMLERRAWTEAAIRPACAVSAGEVAAAFAELRDRFNAPAAARARHLFLSSSGGRDRRAEIEALHETLAAGRATLATLAQRHSDDASTAPGGGDLGYFSLPRAPEVVVGAVRDLPAGEVTAPFESSAGWHLAEVLDRVAARPLEFGRVAPELRARLESLRRREALASLRGQLRSRPARHIERYYLTLASNQKHTLEDPG